VIAEDLAAQAHSVQAASGQHLVFRFGHLLGFTGQKLDAAGGAAGIATAGVQLVDPHLIEQGQD
jgi:hypothetical protein